MNFINGQILLVGLALVVLLISHLISTLVYRKMIKKTNPWAIPVRILVFISCSGLLVVTLMLTVLYTLLLTSK